MVSNSAPLLEKTRIYIFGSGPLFCKWMWYKHLNGLKFSLSLC